MLQFEEFRMRAASFEDEQIIIDFIDKQPIGFDIAFPPACIIPNEFVIPEDWIKYFACQQGSSDQFELIDVPPLLFS